MCVLRRTNIAHDMKHVDPIGGSSLAARVCNDEPGLEYNSQAAVFIDIIRYEDLGRLLCSLCIFIWITSVIADVGAAIRLIAVAYQLRGGATEIIVSAETGNKHVKALSNRRAAWFIL